jgi:Holliday junction resolvasome RuvABC ATP-dependent DNA helicase subunit
MGFLKGWGKNMEAQNNKDVIKQNPITCLSQVRGQPHVVRYLENYLEDYFKSCSDKSPKSPTFGSVCFSGPEGTGKAMMAWLLHKDLGNQKFVEKKGVALNKKQELYSLLINADDKTTIVINEAQSLNIEAQHILLPALSEHQLCLPCGFC